MSCPSLYSSFLQQDKKPPFRDEERFNRQRSDVFPFKRGKGMRSVPHQPFRLHAIWVENDPGWIISTLNSKKRMYISSALKPRT